MSEGELPCPVCEMVDELRKAGDKASKKLAGELAARKSFWVNVIDRANEEAGPQIFTPGKIIFGSLVAIFQDVDYGDFTDVKEGFDLTIERTGTGIETEYEVRPKPRKTKLSDDPDLVKEWLEKAKDLTVVEVSDDPDEDKDNTEGHVLWIMPYDRIVSEYDLDDVDAISDASDEDEEPEEKPKKKAKKPVEVVDEEDEDDEDEDEDEEEEPAAKKVVHRRIARRTKR